MVIVVVIVLARTPFPSSLLYLPGDTGDCLGPGGRGLIFFVGGTGGARDTHASVSQPTTQHLRRVGARREGAKVDLAKAILDGWRSPVIAEP